MENPNEQQATQIISDFISRESASVTLYFDTWFNRVLGQFLDEKDVSALPVWQGKLRAILDMRDSMLSMPTTSEVVGYWEKKIKND